MAEFDRFSERYEALHADAVRLGGSPRFFHRSKATLLRRLLGAAFAGALLDFGCGVGGLLAELRELLPGAVLHGYDPSADSARRAAALPGVARVTADEAELDGQTFDAIVVANVLHHVDPPARPALVRALAARLAPGGTLAVFEHNPLNPLTRRVVRLCPFDEGVVLLGAGEVRGLITAADGALEVRQRYTTFFPEWLRWAAPVERWLGRLPLGAQTCTTAWRPA